MVKIQIRVWIVVFILNNIDSQASLRLSRIGRRSTPQNSMWHRVRMPGQHSRTVHVSLVALYRAIRLRFGYGFESCDANGPRNVKNANLAKHRALFFSPFLPVGINESVLRVRKRGQFHAAIRVTRKRCDSCAQGALRRRTVSRRNF